MGSPTDQLIRYSFLAASLYANAVHTALDSVSLQIHEFKGQL